MRVDGRDITVAGSLLQPLARRTNDIVRLALATLFLAIVVTSSLITRNDWVGLEKSVSRIVGVLTPTQSNLVYLAYGIAILALPFMILVGLIAARQWKLLGAYAAAGLYRGAVPVDHRKRDRRAALAFRPLRAAVDHPVGVPRRPPVDRDAGRRPDRVRPVAAGPLAAVVVDTALGVRADPPGGQRGVPARSLLGLSVGWFVGALVVRVVGTPALEVPLDGAVRALARRGFLVNALTVVRPAARDRWSCRPPTTPGRKWSWTVRPQPAQRRCAAAVLAVADLARQRDRAAAGFDASRRRTPRPDGDRRRRPRVANTTTMAVAALDRGWTLYRPHPAERYPGREVPDEALVTACGDRWVCFTATRFRTATCGSRRSPSTRARRSSAASATPSTARPTNSCSPTSPNCW